MRHIDHGDAQRCLQMLDFKLHPFAQLLVQCAERFVHQDQRGLKHQRPGQGHALLLATRKLRGLSIAHRFKADTAKGALDLFACCVTLNPAIAQRESHVFRHRHMRKKRIVLKHETDVALFRRQLFHRFAIKQDMAKRRAFKPAEHHQGGGLARA